MSGRPKKFVLLGAAGFIAPRHMKAIKETGNLLIAAMDKSDSVGIIDSFFPDAEFFTDFEELDDFVSRNPADFASICTPNHLHFYHISWAMRRGMDVICEKPLVLNPKHLDELEKLEAETGKKIYAVLQLRLHPSVQALREMVLGSKGKIYDIKLNYITTRGKWYYKSWKGDLNKSGGVVVNIGIHFLDMLIWIFGDVKNVEVHQKDPVRKMKGYLELEKARVEWFLSLDYEDLPEEIRKKGQRTYRSLTIEGKEFEFSKGFEDLHTELYRQVFDGKGFGIEDVRPSIELAWRINHEL